MPDLFSLDAYQYTLPQELIAQHPLESRDQSRLLLVDRQAGELSEIPFLELSNLLCSGDSLVLNNTKVIPARLLGKRSGGGQAEIFLLKRVDQDHWEVLAKPGKKLQIGNQVFFGEDFFCEILATLESGNKIVHFSSVGIFEEQLKRYGQIPLPHYIQRSEKLLTDQERYQTVFATHEGAVAAPTAGLHFTCGMLRQLQEKGIEQNYITLHVGAGTFKPVQTNDIRMHVMHHEPFSITPDCATRLNARQNDQRQICVGTTCCRALESASNEAGMIIPGDYQTDIFIYPGYRFKYVRSLLTNFHLPGSSLLMLVSAIAGYELIREAYKKAIKERFRFYSYGDAMLIL